MAPTPHSPRLGKYLLLGLIGEGSAGVVHEALDPVLGRRVAVKSPRAEPATGAGSPDASGPARIDTLRRRFLVEARVAGRIDHPNVVAVHDYGEHEGRPFIVMERVRGRPLSARLVPGRRVPLVQAARWALPLLEALDAVHRRGVVHRDVKPANVFMTDDGRVKLGDFGIAQVDEPGLAAAVGTPHGAAPEQWAGGRVTSSADLWAVGVMLYLALTGQRPFAGTLLEVMHQVAHRDPPPPSSLVDGLPGAVDRVVMQALRRAPAERPPDAAAFADALARAMAGPGAVRASSGRPLPSRRRDAARRLADADAQLARGHAALDAAQCLWADGTLLVEAEDAATRAAGRARAFESLADTLAGRALDGEALDPSVCEALRQRSRLAREAALAQAAMAARLQHERARVESDVLQRLDRLEDRLAILEAYAAQDARQLDAWDAAGGPRCEPPRPAAEAWRRLRQRVDALDAARAPCAASLRRIDTGARLTPALRARTAAAGLRLAAHGDALRRLGERLERWRRRLAAAPP